MTRDESLTIVEMIVSGWPDAKPLDREEIDMYARAIQDLDAEIATHAVLKAVKDTPYRLKPSELRERVRAAKRTLAAEVPPLEGPEGRPLPQWIRVWFYARHIKSPPDMRRLKEQGDYGDLTQELMPEGAYLKEIETIRDEDVYRALGR